MGRTTQIVSMPKLQMFAKTYWFCELVYYILPNFYFICVNIITNNVPVGANNCPISNNACAAIPLGLNVKN